MSNQVATRDNNPVSAMPDFMANAITTFEGVEKIANLMAKMGTMPKHLVDKPADCFRIVVQAAKWRMDPFAVAECTSLVHGRMCFEGKLVSAVLTSLNAIEGRLKYEITGSGQGASIVISGKPRGSDEVCILHGSVKEWKTTHSGSPWEKIPEDMLVYRGTRQWARRYAPEALLGVYTPDEMSEVVMEATASVVPDAAESQGREVDAKPVDKYKKSPAKKQEAKQEVRQEGTDAEQVIIMDDNEITVANLVTRGHGLYAKYKTAALSGLKNISSKFGIKHMGELPESSISDAIVMFDALEAELEAGAL